MTSEISDVYFCFGRNRGSYLLDTKKQLYKDGMPYEMELHLKNVRTVYYAAVDDHGNCVIAWKDGNGTVLHWEAPEIRKRYPELVNILDEGKPAAAYAAQMSVAFGPNSYVGCYYKMNGARWQGIHQQLSNSIKQKDRVRHCALGVDNCYVILYAQTFAYSVSTRYPILDGILSRLDNTTTITFVALNPWAAGEFFLVLDNDMVYYAVHASLERKIQEILTSLGFTANSMVRYNPTQTVARVPNIRVKNGNFMKEMLGYTVGGVVSGVAGALVVSMNTCSIM